MRKKKNNLTDFGSPAEFTRKHYTDKELVEGWLKEGLVKKKDLLKYRKRTGRMY